MKSETDQNIFRDRIWPIIRYPLLFLCGLALLQVHYRFLLVTDFESNSTFYNFLIACEVDVLFAVIAVLVPIWPAPKSSRVAVLALAGLIFIVILIGMIIFSGPLYHFPKADDLNNILNNFFLLVPFAVVTFLLGVVGLIWNVIFLDKKSTDKKCIV
jgi:hypothetical protein